jgi:hypothetical protein
MEAWLVVGAVALGLVTLYIAARRMFKQIDNLTDDSGEYEA